MQTGQSALDRYEADQSAGFGELYPVSILDSTNSSAESSRPNADRTGSVCADFGAAPRLWLVPPPNPYLDWFHEGLCRDLCAGLSAGKHEKRLRVKRKAVFSNFVCLLV